MQDTSAGLSSTTAITSRGYGVVLFMAVTFPCWIDHTTHPEVYPR
jgi:hypothetical protein